MKSFVPAVSGGEGGAALARALASRGCRIERVISHTQEPQLDLQSSLGPAVRLFTQSIVEVPGGPTVWVVDETVPGTERWDPRFARELSAEFGGFAVSTEFSRVQDRYGYAVFFAGRTIEFTSYDHVGGRFDAGGASGAFATSLEDEVPSAFADVYSQLTGSPASVTWQTHARLSSTVAACPEPASAWRPTAGEERPLALAVFALVDEQEFGAAWKELGAGDGWQWHPAHTTASRIPYVLLTRDADLDIALCDALAGRLNVPAGAVAVNGPGASFTWWSAQPPDAVRHGQKRGAADFVRHLTSATVAFGERPGVLRIPRV